MILINSSALLHVSATSCLSRLVFSKAASRQSQTDERELHKLASMNETLTACWLFNGLWMYLVRRSSRPSQAADYYWNTLGAKCGGKLSASGPRFLDQGSFAKAAVAFGPRTSESLIANILPSPLDDACAFLINIRPSTDIKDIDRSLRQSIRLIHPARQVRFSIPEQYP